MSKENESLLWISGGRNFQRSKEGRKSIFFLYVDMKLYLLEYTLTTEAMTANNHIYDYIHDSFESWCALIIYSAYQCSSDTVLLSYIAVVSGHICLKPDMISIHSRLLQRQPERLIRLSKPPRLQAGPRLRGGSECAIYFLSSLSVVSRGTTYLWNHHHSSVLTLFSLWWTPPGSRLTRSCYLPLP